MKIKTSELTGAALDWAVATAQGWVRCERQGAEGIICAKSWYWGDEAGHFMADEHYSPAEDWRQCGPLIDQFSPSIKLGEIHGKKRWFAEILVHHEPMGLTYGIGHGETALIAVCRALVIAKNDRIRQPHDHAAYLNQQIIDLEVDVPDELLIEADTRGWARVWPRA